MSLTQAQWDRVQELYARAIELPEQEQPAYFEQAKSIIGRTQEEEQEST
jgi:hypothetical protein